VGNATDCRDNMSTEKHASSFRTVSHLPKNPIQTTNVNTTTGEAKRRRTTARDGDLSVVTTNVSWLRFHFA